MCKNCVQTQENGRKKMGQTRFYTQLLTFLCSLKKLSTFMCKALPQLTHIKNSAVYLEQTRVFSTLSTPPTITTIYINNTNNNKQLIRSAL